MSTHKLTLIVIAAAVLAACAAPAMQPTTVPQATATPVAQSTTDPNEPVSSTPDEPGLDPLDVPTAVYDPAPTDAQLQTGEAFVDSTEIIVAESFPPQFFLSIKGSLPTPCYALRISTSGPDAQHRIMVDVYSVVDPNISCMQVLAAFEQNVRLGTLPAGRYEVWVNNQPIGEIEAP
jgi:hypothetical protein